MAKKNEKKEKSIGDKVLKSVNDFAKRTLFIPSLVFDRIYSDVTGKPTDYNKALYASIDPTGQRPDFSINGVAEAIANTYKFLKKYYDRDFENIDYIKDIENIPLQNRVAIAAWAKYNKLPYDESLIIDNGDGTYSLPKEIEKSMRKDRSDIEKVYKINKKNYDKRRGDYEKRLDIARSNNDMSDYNKVRSEMEQDDELFYLKTAVNMDKKNLEAMDSLMAGKPSVFNEFNYKNRNIRNIEENRGMLNVLGNHTLYKRDDGRVGYRDIYDLNQPFDFLLGGAPFYIRGVAGGIPSNKVKKKQDGGSSEEDPMEDKMRRYYQDKRDEKRAKDWISNWLAKRVEILGQNVSDSGISEFGDMFRSNKSIGERERKYQSDHMNSFKTYTHDAVLSDIPEELLRSYALGLLGEEVDDFESLADILRYAGVGGLTDGDTKTIYYPRNPTMNTRIHENTHAGENRKFLNSYNPQTRIIGEGKQKKYRLEGVGRDDYWDSSSEIYARLNEFRYLNNIDPKKVYTIEDVQKMREDKNTKDRELLNRYNDDFILFLLNEVAMTDGNDNDDVFYAKDGGSVRKKQDYIYNRLVDEHGFAPVQAVAIVANLTHESGLTDDILGDNGASYGLQQWQGQRRKNLFSFAKSKGRSKPTLEDQVDFLAHEYKNNQAFQFKNKGQNLYQEGKVNNDIFDYFQYSKADFDNAESLWDATIAWNQGVGRPNKKYAFNGRRYEIAVHLANRYGVEYGKERKYTDMGYSDMVQQEPVNTGDKKQDYYENYGKQILVNVLPAQTPGAVQSVSSSETNVEKKLDEDEEYNAEQIEAMRQEQEMEKRRALVAAFLPNIQLKIKGTSKTAN